MREILNLGEVLCDIIIDTPLRRKSVKIAIAELSTTRAVVLFNATNFNRNVHKTKDVVTIQLKPRAPKRDALSVLGHPTGDHPLAKTCEVVHLTSKNINCITP